MKSEKQATICRNGRHRYIGFVNCQMCTYQNTVVMLPSIICSVYSYFTIWMIWQHFPAILDTTMSDGDTYLSAKISFVVEHLSRIWNRRLWKLFMCLKLTTSLPLGTIGYCGWRIFSPQESKPSNFIIWSMSYTFHPLLALLLNIIHATQQFSYLVISNVMLEVWTG